MHMQSVPRSRVVLVLSLVLLSGSLAVFGTVTGITSATTAAADYEFTIENGALVETSGGTNETLVADLRTVQRVTITNLDTSPVVQTTAREPPELTRPQRKQAKQIVTRKEAITDTLATPTDAVYTMRPIPTAIPSDRAAVIGADPDTTWGRFVAADESAFTVQNGTAAGTVVINRTDPQRSDERALVVVEPINQDVRYSIVVDLQNETIDAFVRLRGTPA